MYTKALASGISSIFAFFFCASSDNLLATLQWIMVPLEGTVESPESSVSFVVFSFFAPVSPTYLGISWTSFS